MDAAVTQFGVAELYKQNLLWDAKAWDSVVACSAVDAVTCGQLGNLLVQSHSGEQVFHPSIDTKGGITKWQR